MSLHRSISQFSGLAGLCLLLGLPAIVNADDAVELAAIRAQASTYLEALNEGDQATLAATWTNEGEFVDAAGRAQNAQELVAQKFGGELNSQRGPFRLTERSLRLITPDVAIQEGTTEFAERPGHVAVSHFTATWVKRDGSWLLESLHESIPPRPPRNTRFDELSWLLGEFSGQADDGTNIVVVAAVSHDGNFILRDLLVTLPDGSVHTLNQRIVWDAISSSFKSWIFDSDGSYGEGTWKRHGENWIVTNSGATPNGRLKSAVNLYTRIEPEGFFVESVGAMVGNELRPNVKVRLVRESARQ